MQDATTFGGFVSQEHIEVSALYGRHHYQSLFEKKNQFVSSASIDNDNVPNSFFFIYTSHFPFSLPNFPQIEKNFCTFRQNRAVILVG